MTPERWLEKHPYLAPITRFHGLVEEALSAAPVEPLAAPRLDGYGPELERGVPFLASVAHGVDAVPAAAAALRGACERLAARELPAGVAPQLAALRAQLARSPDEPARVVAWALAGADPAEAPLGAGVAAFLSWMALRRVLAPALEALAAWRGDRWTRGDCPTCGAQPAMAQLVADGDVRHRRLSCGRCGTSWRYRRFACPHCTNEEPDRLSALEAGGEGAPLRLDWCDACQGYVKTYAGEGDEALLLSDWSTLHLDALAAGRGLRRAGASLYTL